MITQEALDMFAKSLRKYNLCIQKCVESLKELNEALNRVNSGEKTYRIELIKNNQKLGNANKRRLIRMICRAYRERAKNGQEIH